MGFSLVLLFLSIFPPLLSLLPLPACLLRSASCGWGSQSYLSLSSEGWAADAAQAHRPGPCGVCPAEQWPPATREEITNHSLPVLHCRFVISIVLGCITGRGRDLRGLHHGAGGRACSVSYPLAYEGCSCDVAPASSVAVVSCKTLADHGILPAGVETLFSGAPVKTRGINNDPAVKLLT